MIMKHINRSSHRPKLNHSRIGHSLLDHTLHGNGRTCSRKMVIPGERIAEKGESEDTDDAGIIS